MVKTTSELRSWIEIDTKALARNVKYLKRGLSKKTELLCVVKSNAYGHGIVEISLILQKMGGVRLAVDSFEEAMLLRKHAIKLPILVLGYTPKVWFRDASKHSIEITISNMQSLRDVLTARVSKPIHVAIKVDTGLHRQGFLASDRAGVLAMFARKSSKVRITGLYSHFAASEDAIYKKFTRAQVALFAEWVSAFKKAGLNPKTHISSSAGLLVYPYAHFDIARAGIALYGLWPSDDVRKAVNGKDFLAPVLSWKAVISEVKKIKKGEALGYDLTEKVKYDSTIAICPVGYWHGYPRSLSRVGVVLVNGKRAKVLGTISMDMMILDVTGINGVKQGSAVTLIGKSGKENISAEEVSKLAGTINYEIVTRINPEIRRIYK